MTNSQIVLDIIGKHPDGLDDDELSDLTGIKPRQQIYQICTQLEGRGEVRRESVIKEGKRRKIHNFPVENHKVRSASVVTINRERQHPWQKRLGALVAATGMDEASILDEALANYALEVLRSQDTDLQEEPA